MHISTRLKANFQFCHTFYKNMQNLSGKQLIWLPYTIKVYIAKRSKMALYYPSPLDRLILSLVTWGRLVLVQMRNQVRLVHSSALEGCNLHEMSLGQEWYFLIGIPYTLSGLKTTKSMKSENKLR